MATATTEAPLPQLLTVKQVCDRLNIQKSKAYELLASGRLRSVKLDGLRRVSAESLTEFCAGLTGGDYQAK